MALLGTYRRIYKQDYSEENQKDIDTLSITVNDSFQSIYSALTNQITLKDNINCTLTTFTVTVDNNGSPTTKTNIKIANYQSTVSGICVINASCNDGTTNPTSGLFINYSINNNTVTSSNQTNAGNQSANPLTILVNKVIGLPANKLFTITAIIF
jgi:hypothetical protein